MTTIDSDSESQDSDDGRRFRFEATRKDDTLRLHSNNRRRSPLSKSSKYRSRSRDRNNHNRRDYDRTKQDRDRKEGADRSDKRKVSKERESRDNNKSNRHAAKGSVKDATTDAKNAKESLRNSSNSKDHKSSKESRSRESKTSNVRVAKDAKKEPRDQESKTKTSETKESRDRDRGLKRPRDSSHDRLSATKHGHRSREKYERSRERSNNRDKGKQLDGDKSKEERSKNIISVKKSPGKQSESKKIVFKREAHSPSKILDQIGSDSESDLGALDPDVGPVMALETFEDCREMNLSDFDIISDTEGSSPETREDNSLSKDGIKVKGEILAPHYYGPKITKRVSRRQYERLVRRQAALNSRRLEEFYKVNRRGEDNTTTQLDPSCNNRSDVSDFLLGTEAYAKAVGERRGSRKIDDDSGEEEYKYKEYKNRESINVDQLKIDEMQIYGPSLPPKSKREYTVVKSLNKDVGDASSSRLRNDKSDKKSPVEASLPQAVSRPVIIGPSLPPGIALNPTSQDEIAKNGTAETESAPIIGPSLPPHLRQDKSNSASSEEQDSTQRSPSVFGPTLPPNFIPKDDSDSDSDGGVLGPMPADHPAAMEDYIQRQLEERAIRMKNKLDGKVRRRWENKTAWNIFYGF